MLGISKWHINRLRSMSSRETIYRASRMLRMQRTVNLQRDKSLKWTSVPDILPACSLDNFKTLTTLDVFGIDVVCSDIVDWMYDVSTEKSFPKLKSSSIDVRTGKLGNVKYVWEINRMLFMPQLAICYRKTGDERYKKQIMQLVTSWADQNPYNTGVNWYSNIEVNIRLINWFLTWELLQAEKIMSQDEEFHDFVNTVWVPCIYRHCRFSATKPSLFSSANNHLLAEYAGLFIASSKWKFAESRRWLRYAMAGVERETEAQHSENGINKEQAAGYIQFVTDFLLICFVVGNNTNNPFSEKFKDRLHSIIVYIRSIVDVKGNIPRYGDDDNGRLQLLNGVNDDNNFISLLVSGSIIFNDPALPARAYEVDQKNIILFGHHVTRHQAKYTPAAMSSAFYPSEGHFVFRKRTSDTKEIMLHFNAAPLGYLSIAAHGHADALSFSLHLDGQPFLIDPGTYCYLKNSPWRNYFVSTRAHNTVSIDGLNQASYVGPTLWLDHYQTTVNDFRINSDQEYASASHDGYKKLGITHTRTVLFLRQQKRFIITDVLSNTGQRVQPVELLFHCHPHVNCSLFENNASLTFGEQKIEMRLDKSLKWQTNSAQTEPYAGWYSPGFYKKTSTTTIKGDTVVSDKLTITSELLIS